MTRILPVLVGLLFITAFSNAQDFEPITHRTTVAYTPPAGQNGVEANIEIGIRYNVFMGEPTRMATGVATIGDRVHYNGEVYTRSQVGDDIFDDFEFGVINIEADIYAGTARISTVRFTSLISGDIPGSPDWDEVFPGVNEEAAKQAFRDRFTIRNVRMVDVRNSIYQIEGWVREQQAEQTYSSAMDRARQLEQAGDLDGAQAAYDEASRAKPGDSAASSARQRIQTEKREQEAEQRRQAQAAEQARQAEQARRDAAAQAQREREQAARDAQQRQADEAADREAERQRRQQEEFDRIQREAEERGRQIDETTETVREGISRGMANSSSSNFFSEGMGPYLKMGGWKGYDDDSVVAANTALTIGLIGPLLNRGRFSFNMGVTVYKGHKQGPFYPRNPVTGEPVKRDDFDFYGGEVGLGMKLGRGWGLVSNLAYPYVSFTLGQRSYAYEVPDGEFTLTEMESDFHHSMEYGVRGMIYMLYYQAGYSEFYDRWVYAIGIVSPIRYAMRKRNRR